MLPMNGTLPLLHDVGL